MSVNTLLISLSFELNKNERDVFRLRDVINAQQIEPEEGEEIHLFSFLCLNREKCFLCPNLVIKIDVDVDDVQVVSLESVLSVLVGLSLFAFFLPLFLSLSPPVMCVFFDNTLLSVALSIAL